MHQRIAHRGMPRLARENTLPGFALALDAGCDGIELDVHATRDGTVVVHHDPSLAGGAAIASLTAAELRRHEAAPRVPIPTLLDVCAMVGRQATLYVEIKGEGIEALVLRTLSDHTGPVAIHGFDHAMIARLHAARCPYPLGVLFEGDAGDVGEVMADTGARDVWPHFPLMSTSLVEAVHRRGGRVIAWTVNDREVGRRLAEMGADGLCGDDVTLL